MTTKCGLKLPNFTLLFIMSSLSLCFSQIQLTLGSSHQASSLLATDSKSHLVKVTTTIMIENDGNTPITHHFIDCDERNGHSRLSHIVAKLKNDPMPVSKTDDGRMWRIDLSAKPIEPGATIPLMVTKVYTHLELVPSHDVYLMPYSSIQYQVRIIKQGRPHKIKIPSEQYYLVVDNRELVDLEESTSTALALETEGTTQIRFVDKSVISDEDFIQPESRIHIVNPSYLTMHVSPGDSWSLQKFTDYTIEIRIFDAQQHQIFPSDNLNIQLTSGNDLVVTNSTTNGTYHFIHTLNSGPSKLVARLLGTTPSLYSYDKPSPEIELVQELNIYEPLDIRPSSVILPWLPEVKPSYQVSIFAAGGTSSYRWSTNNTALTEIGYSGDDSSVAKITTSGEGSALIQCVDTKSSVFLRHSIVVVARIIELSILPSITETELGGDIMLPVAVYANASSLAGLNLPEEDIDNDLVLFHDCSKIKFDVDIVEKTRFSHEPNEVFPNTRPKSCMSLRFTCTQPGSSRVWISYTDPSNPLSRPIKTTTVIACYKPLKPVYPADVGVLALHTSIELAFEGGPRPFGSRIDDHYANLEPINDPIVKFEPIIDRYRYNKDLHVFNAQCMEYGEVLVTLNVGNQPSATLPNPASSTASMKIICAKPDSIQLRPRLKDSCPLNEMASLMDTIVPISTAAPTDFELIVFDDSKRKFLNISSFKINWNLQGQGSCNSRSTEDINAVSGFRRVTRNYITVQPNGQEGQGRLQADLNHYKHQGLYRGQTLDLSASLDIQFVDFAQIHPNRTLLYNHHKNVVVLSILKGSGYFQVESLQGTKHANVTYVSVFGQHRIHIAPLSIGKLAIRLEDQCLDSGLGAPILSEVGIISDTDFSRESLKPGRSMRYCRDIDESMFCLYLSVDKVAAKVQTTARPQTTTPPPIVKTTSAPITERPQTISPTPTIAQPPAKQAVIEPIQQQAKQAIKDTQKQPHTSTTPKVSFGDNDDHQEESRRSSTTSIMQSIMGYMIVLVVTASAITLGYKWWQDQNKRRPNPQFVTDSSFLRQSPGGSGGSVGAGVRFSPNASRGPTSSTPKTRPLYTERFSTTILSD